MRDFARLVLRVTVGTLMAGHGAQKLFGSFGGPGLKGTSGFMEALGITPGKIWGPTVALGEFSGGVLTALGFLNPIGPQNIASAMIVAMRRVHWSKGVWNTEGGIEFPLTNLAAVLALVMVGPGKFSLDRLFGIKLPKWFVALTWINHVGITSLALFRPEAVQMALDRVTGGSQAYTEPSSDQPASDAQVQTETRPISTSNAEAAAHTGT